MRNCAYVGTVRVPLTAAYAIPEQADSDVRSPSSLFNSGSLGAPDSVAYSPGDGNFVSGPGRRMYIPTRSRLNTYSVINDAGSNSTNRGSLSTYFMGRWFGSVLDNGFPLFGPRSVGPGPMRLRMFDMTLPQGQNVQLRNVPYSRPWILSDGTAMLPDSSNVGFAQESGVLALAPGVWAFFVAWSIVSFVPGMLTVYSRELYNMGFRSPTYTFTQYDGGEDDLTGGVVPDLSTGENYWAKTIYSGVVWTKFRFTDLYQLLSIESPEYEPVQFLNLDESGMNPDWIPEANVKATPFCFLLTMDTGVYLMAKDASAYARVQFDWNGATDQNDTVGAAAIDETGAWWIMRSGGPDPNNPWQFWTSAFSTLTINNVWPQFLPVTFPPVRLPCVNTCYRAAINSPVIQG